MDALKFATGYVILRAIFFYSLFSLLYRFFNHKIGIVKELPSKKQILTEQKANIIANIFEIGMIYLVLKSGVIVHHQFSWSGFGLSFLFCYLFFEFWFYGTHRLLHTKYFRFIHKTHHVSVITTPMSALNLSLGEKFLNDLGLLVIPCVLTHYVPLLFGGIMAYHLYNFYINVMGHSNIEIMPKWFVQSFLGKIFVTATYHSLHHLKGNCHYGLFLSFLDKIFGTYDPQYEAFHQEVRSEVGLLRKNVLLQSKGKVPL